MSYHSLPTSKLFQLTTLSLSLALAGCGGGGGDTVDSIAPIPDTGVTQPDTGGGQSDGALDIVSSTLVSVDGNTVTSVGLEGAYYEIQVVNKSKQPIPNAKVSFAINATGVTLSQTTSGSVLTDSSGKARIFLKPDSPEVSGGYVITATVEYENNTANKDLNFSVQATDVQLGDLVAVESQLFSGGQTALSLKVMDKEGSSLSGVLVNLNANCGQLPTQMTSDDNGMVEIVYKSINADNTLCSGNVVISASAGSSTKTTSISVQAPEATSIVYTANPLTLGIQGSGSSATGDVEFTVYSNNTPLANADVILSLEKSPLGLTFGVLGNKSNITAKTDENGILSVNLYPGSTPGPVEIKATLASDSRINALSKGISIASSRVTQTGLSLSWEKNVLDWSYDGDSAVITARMVDRNGNVVPNGTVINFTAEGGQITSSCTTTDGNCEVTFTTQNPRPGDGRVSILAVAEGEKDYIDMNENNAWDQGVDILVHNVGDTFRDDNESGEFEIGEFTYPLTTGANGNCENNLDRYVNLKFPSITDIKKAQYKRNYISEFVSPNKASTCNTDLDTVVRYQGITLLSNGNDARFIIGNLDQGGNFTVRQPQAIFSNDTSITFRVNSGGFYDLNPMPSGTIITGSGIDQTSADPIATIVPSANNNGFVIEVVDANPSSRVIVKVGNIEYSILTDASGRGVSQVFANPPVGDISVVDNNNTCEATLSGVTEVPANVVTGRPGDNLGTFTRFKLKDCEATDEVQIIATTPRGNVTKLTYTIR